MSRMLLPLLILALLLSAVTLPQTKALAQSVFITWEQRYDGGGPDVAYAVAVDSDDNVIVTGYSELGHVYHVANETVDYGNGTETNFTLAHHPVKNGTDKIYLNYNLTTNYTIDYGNGTITFSVAPGEGVLITADYDYEAANYDYYTIKYDPGGNELWNKTYDSGGSDDAHGIAVDSADNIIVTGYSEIEHVYHVVDEDVGTGNDTETNFTLAHYPVINGTETIKFNETPQKQEEHQPYEYVDTGDNSTTVFTLEHHPISVDSETIYLNGTPQKQQEQEDGEEVGIGNGTETNFTLKHHPIIVGTETIYLDGNQTTNYTIDYQNGNITFDTAPGAGVNITADYDYIVYTIDYGNGTITFSVAPGEGVVITADYEYIVYTIDYDKGTITFSVAPVEGVNITADYDYEASNYDYCTIKYDPDGNEITNGWPATYDSGDDDSALAAAVDYNDNVLVTGRSANNYHTIKYDPNGTELWNRTYDGGDFDEATGVAADPDDNIVVTGYSMNATGTGTNDYYSIKYDPDGTELWNVTYDSSGGSDCAQDVAVDSEGNIVITGGSISPEANSTWYYCTVKYYPNGTEFWTAPVTYNLSYQYRASNELLGIGNGYTTEFTMNYQLIIVGSEKIYVDGEQTTINYTIDYRNGRIKFDTAPADGVSITADYTALAGITAYSVAVDAKDNVIITGSYYLPSCRAKWVDGISVIPPIYDWYITLKYSPDGDEIWNRTYDRHYQECAYSVAVDSEDNIIVTGKGSDGKTWNYLSIKYAEQLEMAGGGSGGPIAVIVLLSSAALGGVVYYFMRRRRIGGVVYYSIRGRSGVVYYSIRGRIGRVVDYFVRGRKRS